MNHKVAFGVALRRALQQRGYQQQELAEALGVSTQLVSDWVNGRREPLPRQAVAAEQWVGAEPGTLTIHLGYLPPNAVDVTIASPEDAVIADPSLDGRAKRVILGAIEMGRQTSPPGQP